MSASATSLPRQIAVGLALLLGAGASAGCLTTKAEADLIRSDVSQLKAEVEEIKRERADAEAEQQERLERALARVEALEGTLHSLRQNDADTGVQMEKVIQELQILRGELEEARYAIGQTREALGETKKTVTDILARPPIEVQAAEAAPRVDATDVEKIAGEAVPTEKEPLYEFALNLHKAGNHRAAVDAFELFTDRYKDDKDLVDNAWFWTAEAYYKLGQGIDDKAQRGRAFKKAILSYNKVIDVRYDTGQPSNKEDGALFKIGMAFEALGYTDEPKAFYQEILKQHPASPLAKEAKKRLRALKKRGKNGRKKGRRR